ncbi:hypothetical protein AB0K11_03790 [Mycobacterium sp. NPDC050551]|uniref:hypothetical protein n=1 Tax=Mycobacterium sp. NPDC050551 TaxID=3155407 RepID=UPI003428659E
MAARLNPRRGLLLVASTVSLALGIAAAVFDPSKIILFTVAGIAGLCASAWQLYRGLAVVPRLEVQTKVRDNHLRQMLPSRDEEADGFQLVCDSSVPSAAILYSRHLNAHLRTAGADWPLEVDPAFGTALLARLREQRTEVESVLRYFGRKYIDRDFRNEPKLGFCSPVLTTAKSVRVFRTSYYEAFLTNELCRARILLAESEKPRVFFDLNYPATEHGDARRLDELGTYPFANGLGVSVLGFTRDRHLVFWRQNARAMVARGLLAPTGSGSCDWADYRPGDTLRATVLRAMHREFCEESLRRGVDPDNKVFLRSQLLAFFRNVYRGGKPEFVAIALLDVDYVHLIPNNAEVDRGLDEHQPLRHRQITSVMDLLEYLEAVLRSASARSQLSVPLWVGLMALRDYCREDAQQVAALLRL